MIARFMSAIVTSCMVICVVGCVAMADKDSRAATYTGDGKFVDLGYKTSHDRYLLDLGSYTLNRSAAKTFTLKGLPASQFTIALQIDTIVSKNFPLEPLGQHSKLKFLGGTIVLLQLEEADGNIVFSYKGPLSILNHNVRITSDGPRPILFKEPSADQQGTRFMPRRNTVYTLRFNILKAAEEAQNVKLIAIGHSGWK